jgi:hypothetical protein
MDEVCNTNPEGLSTYHQIFCFHWGFGLDCLLVLCCDVFSCIKNEACDNSGKNLYKISDKKQNKMWLKLTSYRQVLKSGPLINFVATDI